MRSMPREPLAVPILAVALAIGAIAAMTGTWTLAVLVPIVAVVYVLWPAAAAATLVVACALDRLAIGIGGSNVRLDELAALALAGVLLVRALFARDSLGLKSNGRDQGLKSRATARHSSLTTHRS